MAWRPTRKGSFEVKSYYRVLSDGGIQSFTRRSIWKVKVPHKFFSLFAWAAAKGKILKLDNLGKRNICIVNRYCMSKNSWELVNHLLLHYSYAQSSWNFNFSLFSVSWVMPRHVVELLACWRRGVGQHWAAFIWEAILLCIMWTIWENGIFKLLRGRSIPLLG